MNKFIHGHERIVELYLSAATVNYRDCLLENFKEVQDPFGREIADIQYDQNPADTSQVIRNITFGEKTQ